MGQGGGHRTEGRGGGIERVRDGELELCRNKSSTAEG